MKDTAQLLPSRLVCRRYSVCDRTLARWQQNPQIDFPQPTVINRRKYFDASALDAFDRRMTVAAAAGQK